MALPEPIDLAVERVDGVPQTRVSGLVGIEHGHQRGTEQARIGALE